MSWIIWLFISWRIILTLIFFVVWNPLTLGLILLIQTLSLRIFIGTITNSFWFLYLLILVFIGGILVLFIYVTSIFPNEKFSFNQKLLLSILIFIFTLLTSFIILNNYFIINLNLNNIESILNIKINFNIINTRKIFNSYNNLLLIFLVNYLFYCIIIVIKITNFFIGPLRKITYVQTITNHSSIN